MAAYKKHFNPDALPVHASPEEAAQAMSQLRLGQQPQGTRPTPTPSPAMPNNTQPRPPPPRKSPPRDSRPLHVPPNAPTYNGLPLQHGINQPFSPPPPADYGWGPRPHGSPAGHSSHPSSNTNYPPRTPAPPDADSGELYPLFQVANTSRTGSLTSAELGSALVNADFTPFDPLTIRSLMGMFSTSPTGQPQGPTITFVEFQNLWRFLAAWRELFERFDEDRSGKICLREFSNALVAFGYRLSMPFVGVLYNAYGGQGMERRPSVSNEKGMSFDHFVQACISLKRMTDVFKGYDDDRDGYVTLSFEEFLTEILRLRD